MEDILNKLSKENYWNGIFFKFQVLFFPFFLLIFKAEILVTVGINK